MGENKLSTAEAELYDRQIRLWGIESQEKLRAANVLLIKIRGLGSEIAKDILLSGINSLTILDDGVVTQEETLKNFLLPRDSVGQKIAEAVLAKSQALNPLVKIVADVEPVEKKDEKYFSQFTIVIGTGLSKAEILKVAEMCRKQKVKVICGDNFGMFGYSVADFQEHEFYEDQVKFVGGKKRKHDGKGVEGDEKVERTTVKVSGKLEYPSISDVLVLPEAPLKPKRRNIYFYLMLALLEFRNKFSRDPSTSSKEKDVNELKEIKKKILALFQVDQAKFNDEVFELVFDEIVPVCSIIGGVIAQEVIKAVSGREAPVNNVFLFDPITYNGREENVCLKTLF